MSNTSMFGNYEFLAYGSNHHGKVNKTRYSQMGIMRHFLGLWGNKTDISITLSETCIKVACCGIEVFKLNMGSASSKM